MYIRNSDRIKYCFLIGDNNYEVIIDLKCNQFKLRSTDTSAVNLSIGTMGETQYKIRSFISKKLKNRFAKIQILDGQSILIDMESLAHQINGSAEEIRANHHHKSALWHYCMEHVERIVNKTKESNTAKDLQVIEKFGLTGKKRELVVGLHNKIDLIKEYLNSHPGAFDTLSHEIEVSGINVHFKVMPDETDAKKISITLGVVGEGAQKNILLEYAMKLDGSEAKFLVDYQPKKDDIPSKKELQFEMEMLRVFSNQEGLPAISWAYDADQESKPMMELYHADILDFHKVLKGTFSVDVAIEILHQLLNGLGCIHANGFTHNDVRSQNVLINQMYKDPLSVQAVLCDFGLMKPIDDDNNGGSIERDINQLGKMFYFLINRDQYKYGEYSLFADEKINKLNRIIKKMVETSRIDVESIQAELNVHLPRLVERASVA